MIVGDQECCDAIQEWVSAGLAIKMAQQSQLEICSNQVSTATGQSCASIATRIYQATLPGLVQEPTCLTTDSNNATDVSPAMPEVSSSPLAPQKQAEEGYIGVRECEPGTSKLFSVLGSDADVYGANTNQCSEACMNEQVVNFVPFFEPLPCHLRGFSLFNRTEVVEPLAAPVPIEFHVFGRKICADDGQVYAISVGAHGAVSESQCSEFCVPSVAVAATSELEEGSCFEKGFLTHVGNKEVTIGGFPTTVSVYEGLTSCYLTCSGHGICKLKEHRPYCDCEEGWLTSDCSVQTLTHLKGVPSEHKYDWILTGESLHYYRPADKSIVMNQAPLEVRRPSMVANHAFPGPLVVVDEGEQVMINVRNEMHWESTATTIHWHGMNQRDTPWMDGVAVSQCPITPGQNFTYSFTAEPAGTHWWHAHMGGHRAYGLQGGFIVRPKPEDDHHAFMYDDEMLWLIQDWYKNPALSTMSGSPSTGLESPVEIESVLFNGISGDGSASLPFPQYEVEEGRCYRIRLVHMSVTAQMLNVSIAGHAVDIIAVDSHDIEPVSGVRQFMVEQGSRRDIVLCADQEPGNYLITAEYSMVCSGTGGERAPNGCKFYAYLKYASHNEPPTNLQGTGGGTSPLDLSHLPIFDTSDPEVGSSFRNIVPQASPEPDEEVVQIVLDMGWNSEQNAYYFAQRDHVTKTGNGTSWHPPSTPLVHTKGDKRCAAAAKTPIVEVPEGIKWIELVFNNAAMGAHPLHFHGHFQVLGASRIGFAELFSMSYKDAPCDEDELVLGAPRSFSELASGQGTSWWACGFNEQKHRSLLNVQDPPSRDIVFAWRKSWTVVRYKTDRPGFWMLHCHLTSHAASGLQTVVSVQPANIGDIPENHPTCGLCRNDACTAGSTSEIGQHEEPAANTLLSDSSSYKKLIETGWYFGCLVLCFFLD